MLTESHEKGGIVEKLAAKYLESNGYTILKTGKEIDEYNPFDYLVEKDGNEFFVEVKRKDIKTTNLNKNDRIFDFGWSEFKFLKERQNRVLIVIGWVTERNDIGFGIFNLMDFSDKSPNRKKGKHLKLSKNFNYSPVRNPSMYCPMK